MKLDGYETHPAADVFPLLDGKDFDALVADIRTNGLLEPIRVVGDKILDGRNRLRACIVAKVEPRFIQYAGDPWEYAWSANVERRHLEAGSRAAYRLKWKAERERWGERRAERVRSGHEAKAAAQRGKPKNCAVNVYGTNRRGDRDRESRVELAKDAGVSPVTAQKAITVHDKSPELFAKVVAGEVTLNRAYRDTTRREAAAKISGEPQPLPVGPFRVLVADPPWAYTKRKDDGSHRSALSYPDMTTEEICALPVRPIAHEDAVLWLWTTNAFMRDAYRVLDAWGFEEKTILTWAKDRMGTGDWLRGQTEHCILAVRGKPLVMLTNQTTLLTASLREHSRKPDEFYAIVDALCPGSKVELFARQPRSGWVAWGAESEKFDAAE